MLTEIQLRPKYIIPRGASKQFQNNNKSGFTELSVSRVPKTGIRNQKEVKVLLFSFLGVNFGLNSRFVGY